MTRRPSPKIAAYVGVAALALLAGLALGRPELVAAAAPLAVLVVAGLAGARDPDLAAEVAVDQERALVGDQVTVRLHLRATAPVERLEVLVAVPPGLEGPEGAARAWAVAVAKSDASAVAVAAAWAVACARAWAVAVRAADRACAVAVIAAASAVAVAWALRMAMPSPCIVIRLSPT